MKQQGGDFSIKDGHLDKIHRYLSELKIKNSITGREHLLGSYKKFLLLIHPDRGGETELFQIFGSPITEGTFLYFLKRIEPNNDGENPNVKKLTGHDHFTIDDIINLTSVSNPKFNMFKTLLENITAQKTNQSNEISDVIGFIMNFGACSIANAGATAIDIDTYIGLLEFYGDIIEEASKINDNPTIRDTCLFLKDSVKEKVSEVHKYKEHILLLKTGGMDKEDNKCPEVFSTGQWKDWLKKKEEIKDADAYSKLRNALIDNTRTPNRLVALSDEINEVSVIMNEKYPNLDLNHIKEAMVNANKMLTGFETTKQNLIFPFILTVLGTILSYVSTTTNYLTGPNADLAFLIINIVLIFGNPVLQTLKRKNIKNMASETWAGIKCNFMLILVVIILLFSGLFYIYGNQDHVAWFAYSAHLVPESQVKEYQMALNFAAVAGRNGTDILPNYVDVDYAIRQLQQKLDPNYVAMVLQQQNKIDIVKFLTEEPLLGGKNNKTKFKKNQKHRNKKTRKNKKIFGGGLSSALGREAAEALAVGVQGAARITADEIKKLVELIASGKKEEVTDLAKILKFPQEIINLIRNLALKSDNAPTHIKAGLNMLLKQVPQIEWGARMLSIIGDKIPRREQIFTFMDSSTYFKLVSSLASYTHSLGSLMSSKELTGILSTIHIGMLAYPDCCGFINTAFPKKFKYSMFRKNIQDEIASKNDLDCIREYLLMKFYESLIEVEKNIEKIDDHDVPPLIDDVVTRADVEVLNQQQINPQFLADAKHIIGGPKKAKLDIYKVVNKETGELIRSKIFTSIEAAKKEMTELYYKIPKKISFKLGEPKKKIGIKPLKNDRDTTNYLELTLID